MTSPSAFACTNNPRPAPPILDCFTLSGFSHWTLVEIELGMWRAFVGVLARYPELGRGEDSGPRKVLSSRAVFTESRIEIIEGEGRLKSSFLNGGRIASTSASAVDLKEAMIHVERDFVMEDCHKQRWEAKSLCIVKRGHVEVPRDA